MAGGTAKWQPKNADGTSILCEKALGFSFVGVGGALTGSFWRYVQSAGSCSTFHSDRLVGDRPHRAHDWKAQRAAPSPGFLSG